MALSSVKHRFCYFLTEYFLLANFLKEEVKCSLVFNFKIVIPVDIFFAEFERKGGYI